MQKDEDCFCRRIYLVEEESMETWEGVFLWDVVVGTDGNVLLYLLILQLCDCRDGSGDSMGESCCVGWVV